MAGLLLEDMAKLGRNIPAILVMIAIVMFLVPGAYNTASASVGDFLFGADPKVQDFSVSVKDSGTFALRYRIIGDLNKIENVVVSRRYAYLPDDSYGSASEIEHLNINNKNLDWFKDNGGIMAGEEDMGKRKAGKYKFSVEVLDRDGFLFEGGEKEVEVKVYEEDYVETLNGGIPDCGNSRNSNCNVIECKKQQMSITTIGAKNLPADDLISQITASTCLAFNPSAGLTESRLDFSQCSASDVDKANSAFTPVHMLVFAGTETGGNILTKDDFQNYADNVAKYYNHAAGFATYCTHGSGVYQFMDSTGWLRLPAGDPLNVRENEAYDALSDYLKDATPGITNVRADVNDDKSISVSWEIAVGSESVKPMDYRITHFHKRWERGETSDNVKAVRGDIQYLGGASTSVVVPNDGDYMGRHYVLIEILDNGNAVHSREVSAGLFDERYINLYKGGADDCQFASLTRTGRHECDPYNQMRDELETDRFATGRDTKNQKIKQIIADAPPEEFDKSRCKYKSQGVTLKQGFIDECTPEDVFYVFNTYYNGADAGDVSLVKRELRETLIYKGWREFT